MMNDILLNVSDLHTFFHTPRGVVKAVDGVDLSISRGETVGLVGESGCGKSATALSIIRLIERPGRIERGSVIFEDRDLLELTESEMRNIRGNRISIIFQEPLTSLNPVHRVGHQISECIRLHQRLSKRSVLELTVDMLRRVGIPDPEKRLHDYPHQMSGGMRQRVMIAIALSCKPQIIIADEPTTALDVTIQAQILDLMNKLKEEIGLSILLITHDLGVVAEMAQSVMVMYAGKVVEYAKAQDLFIEPRHPYTRGLIDSIPKMDGPIGEDRTLQAIPGVVPSLLEMPEGCSFQRRCVRSLDLCSKREPLLFEVESNHFVRCWHFGRP